MPDRPNVLWIFCDELRADAVGRYGNEHADIATPAIDSIADAGTSFHRFYVDSPVCVPSRAAYLSGQVPHRTGIYHNEGLFLPSPTGARSFVERFGEAGYTTVSLGKEHVPVRLRGFEVSDADGAQQFELMVEADAHRERLGVVAEAVGIHSGTLPSDVSYPPDRLTDHALRWLHTDRPEDQPWFLRVSYLQPHTPVVVPEPWASRYDTQAWPDEFGSNAGLSEYERTFAAAAGSQDLTPAEIVAAQSCYHGLASWIDDQVGRLLDALDELGQRESTVVVFASDHGAQLGELGGAYGKMTFSHWSHRVPFMVSWAGHITAGEERSELARSVDLGPTLLDLAGLDVPAGLDGRRLFTDPAPDAITASIGYGNPTSRAFAMRDQGDFHGSGWPQRFCVRTDRWRYDRSTRADGEVLESRDQDRFLADRRSDPREENNVVDGPMNTGVVDELEALLVADFSTGSQLRPEDYARWSDDRDQRLAEQIKGL